MLPSPLWAIGFSNLPLLQLGVAAASLPILIHLLNRRKYREVPFAAMRFLLAAIRKNQRRVKVEQWLLLLVRTLLVLLVVTAMAKPFLESLGALGLVAGQRTHRVVVLDASLSMAYTAGTTSRFDQAKALAARLVRDTRGGDALSVVLMADPPRVVIGDASPSANLAEVLKEIDQVRLPHGGTDLVASFAAVDRVLEVSSIPRKEVVFVTDLQAASWRRAGNEEALRRAIAKIEARRVQSIVIDLGKDGGENRAVVDLRLNQPVVTVGATDLVATATVRNFGPASYNGKARLLIDGQLGPEEAIEALGVGEARPVVFRPTFSAPGDHVLEVKIDDDPLLLDNRRWLALPVKEALNVLLVDGHPKSEPFESETDFLAQALSPSVTPQGVTSPIKVDVVAESGLGRRDLAPYDAVVLANVGQFREAEVATLEAYLKQGGGVVVFGGDQIVPENYDRLLFADGKGLLPASIGPTVGDDQRRSAFEFNPLGFAHPIVKPYLGSDGTVAAGLINVKTYRYEKLSVPPGSQAKVALAFSSGDPAIVEAPRHRGRVVQVATSADAGWTSWPVHPSFAPVMEQVILLAAGGRLAERNVRVGQPLDQVLPASASGTPADVVRPDETKVQVRLKASGDVSLFHFEETDLSGPYKVRYAAPGSAPAESTFSADPDPAESDPAKLDKAGLAAAVPGWKFNYLTNWQDLTGNATSVGRRGELHRPLLYAVLLLLLVESIMAWRYGHHAA